MLARVLPVPLIVVVPSQRQVLDSANGVGGVGDRLKVIDDWNRVYCHPPPVSLTTSPVLSTTLGIVARAAEHSIGTGTAH